MGRHMIRETLRGGATYAVGGSEIDFSGAKLQMICKLPQLFMPEIRWLAGDYA